MKLTTERRPASDDDRAFVEEVYFATQRWLIEKLFGWRGDDVERAKFAEFYDQPHTSIISADGQDIGWVTVLHEPDHIELDHLYLREPAQGRGFGTEIVRSLIAEAQASGREIRLSTARINPARRLYERLGFHVVDEDNYKVYMSRNDA